MPGHRARGLPRRGGQRERHRRPGHGAAGHVHVRARCSPTGPTGQVDAGLGKATPLGSVGLIPPTEEISVTGTELDLDGVRVVFQSTPGTEAPAEMNFHFPDLRLLCMAENCTHNLHNLYTPRGAQVRDALAWSKYIGEAIDLFADDTDTCFASHHWPRFGGGRRPRLPRAAARPLPLDPRPDDAPGQPRPHAARDRRAAGPAAVAADRVPRPGLLRHGQPQREGGVPALHRLVRRQPGQPPRPARRSSRRERYVEYMGGADGVLERARRGLRRRRVPLGRPGASTTSSSPIPTTTTPAPCRPTPSSSSATRPSRRRGATST